MNTARKVPSRYLAGVAILAMMIAACAASLTVEEQKSQILRGDIRFEKQTVEGFLAAWGKPTYTHRERMHFYTLENGNNMPQFRTPMGEVPPDWTTKMLFDDALFFGYADQGELLGFIDGHVVYREKVLSAEVHAVGKAWAREELFKTRLETPTAPTPAK